LGRGGAARCFLNLDGGEWSASRLSHFTPGVRVLGTHMEIEVFLKTGEVPEMQFFFVKVPTLNFLLASKYFF